MKKLYVIILLTLIFLLFTSCSLIQSQNTLKSQGKIFGPLVEGLEWGMSEDEAKEALKCEDCEILHTGDEDSKFYTISPSEKTSVYGIEMEYVVYLEDINGVIMLSKIQFKIDDTDIDKLKEKLVKRYDGYEELPGKPFIEDEPLVWYSLDPVELDDYDEVMEVIKQEYGDGIYYETWAEGFSRQPLAWSILYEDNHEYWNNTLWVYGIDLSMVEYQMRQE